MITKLATKPNEEIQTEEQQNPGILSKLALSVKQVVGKITGFFKSVSTPAPACSATGCSVTPPSGGSTTQALFTQPTFRPTYDEENPRFSNSTQSCGVVTPNLAEPGLVGNLYHDPVTFWSLVLAIPEEIVAEYCKSIRCKEDEIFGINLTLRSIAMYFLTNTELYKTPAIPLGHFLLTKFLGLGMEEKRAGYLSSAITIGGLMMCMEFAPVAVSMSAGLLVTSTVKFGVFAFKNYSGSAKLETTVGLRHGA